MNIDPPVADYDFTPTSAWEANWLRSYGVEMCLDNVLDFVEFDYSMTHQYKQHFKIYATGVMETTADLSAAVEQEETRRLHANDGWRP